MFANRHILCYELVKAKYQVSLGILRILDKLTFSDMGDLHLLYKKQLEFKAALCLPACFGDWVELIHLSCKLSGSIHRLCKTREIQAEMNPAV